MSNLLNSAFEASSYARLTVLLVLLFAPPLSPSEIPQQCYSGDDHRRHNDDGDRDGDRCGPMGGISLVRDGFGQAAEEVMAHLLLFSEEPSS